MGSTWLAEGFWVCNQCGMKVRMGSIYDQPAPCGACNKCLQTDDYLHVTIDHTETECVACSSPIRSSTTEAGKVPHG